MMEHGLLEFWSDGLLVAVAETGREDWQEY
jgi:hypothetical protein